jgi:hypothetical protein
MRAYGLLLFGLLSTAPAAHAAGVFLKWDACHADGGAAARTFACDTNTGNEILVCSVALDAALSGLNGFDARIVGQSASGSLPAWWTFKNSGSCRINAATFLTSPAGTNCPSPFPATPFGGLSYTTNVPTAGAIRFNVVAAVPGGSEGAAVAGQEYYLFSLRISHDKTVGAGFCSGCQEPMCLGVGYLELTATGSTDPAVALPMSNAALDQGHLVSWQNSVPGGVYAYQINPPFGHTVDFAMTCNGTTPARRSTWGTVKSLYR